MMSARFWPLAAAVLLAIILTACASRTPEPNVEPLQKSPASGPDLSKARVITPPTSATPQPYIFSGPGATHYGMESAESIAGADANSQAAAVSDWLYQKLIPTAHFDKRLNMAAAELGRFISVQRQPPQADMRQQALFWAGAPDVNPEFLYFGLADPTNTDEIETYLSEWLSAIAKRGGINHIGAAVTPGTDNNGQQALIVTLLGVNRLLSIQPVPKSPPIEHRFHLSGDAVNTVNRLKVYLDFQGEHLLDAPVPLKKGAFSIEIQVPQAPAIYTLELVGHTKDGMRVLFSAPVYNNSEEPSRFDMVVHPPVCSDSESCEKLLHEKINAARIKVAVSPLIVSENLSKVARLHATDMLENHYTAIFDREGRGAAHRLRQEGINSMQAGDVVDGGYDLRVIAENMLQSPSLKAFLTNRSLTQLGCGVALKAHESRVFYSVDCMVATIIDSRDGLELKRAIVDSINALREKEGLTPYQESADFQPIAERAMESLLKNPENSDKIQSLVNIDVETSGKVRRHSIFGVFTIYDLAQLETNSSAQQLVHSDLTFIALGIRKVTDRSEPRRGIFIYYIAYD